MMLFDAVGLRLLLALLRVAGEVCVFLLTRLIVLGGFFAALRLVVNGRLLLRTSLMFLWWFLTIVTLWTN